MTAGITTFQLPFSYAKRLALGDQEIRTPATLEEYLAFSEKCEYKIEYSNKHIVSMGSPTDAHEKIVINFGWTMNNLFSDEDPYSVYGSNLGIFIEEPEAHYKPDNILLREDPAYITHKVGKKNLKSVCNPFAIVEVFSKSTASYDLLEKLPNYKLSPSLQYAIFIAQHKPFVSVYIRSAEDKNLWLNKDYAGLDASFDFEGRKVELRHLYRKVKFPAKKK